METWKNPGDAHKKKTGIKKGGKDERTPLETGQRGTIKKKFENQTAL